MNLADINLGEFAALMERVKSGEEPPAPGPRLVRQPVPPVAAHLSGLSPTACRERLRSLQDEALRRSTNGRWSDVESRAWKGMDLGHRVCLLILAGVGDDFDALSALADRDWREMPPPERVAIKREVRSMRAAMSKAFCLTGNS